MSDIKITIAPEERINLIKERMYNLSPGFGGFNELYCITRDNNITDIDNNIIASVPRTKDAKFFGNARADIRFLLGLVEELSKKINSINNAEEHIKPTQSPEGFKKGT